jgi:hypothetical protein
MYFASMAFPCPITGLANIWPAPRMQPLKKVFVALSHLNIFSNRFAENNMANLLAQKMFRNYNSSRLR